MADCFNTVNAQHGEKLSRKEIAEIVRDINAEREALKAKGAPDVDEALRKMVEEDMSKLEMEKQAKKRRALKEAAKIASTTNRLMRQYGDDPAKVKFGIEALLWGKYRDIPGVRESAYLIKQAQVTDYMNLMQRSIEDSGEGHYQLFASHALDDDIAEALFLIDKPKSASKHLDPRAVEIAEAIDKVSEVIRAEKNEQGAFVMRYSGYAMRNTHDMRLIAKAGKDAWKQFVVENIDIDRSFGVDNPDIVNSILDDLYLQFSTGNHIKEDAGDIIAGAIAKHGSGGSIANKLSQHRGLHWNSGKAAMEYSRRFGAGDLQTAIFATVNTSGRKVGLMKALGPGDPHAALDKIIDVSIKELKAAGKDPSALMSGDWRNKVHNDLARTTGELENPANSALGFWAKAILWSNSVTKLGGAVLAAFPDMAAQSIAARHHSGSMFSGFTRSIRSLISVSSDQRKAAEAAGVIVDHMRYSIAEMAGSIGRPGFMDKSLRLFFKANLLDWWTNRLRIGYVSGMLNDFAADAHLSFDALPADKQLMLRIAGLEKHWPELQKAVRQGEDGRMYMTAEAMERGEAQFKFQMMVRDWTDSAVPDPGPRTKAITRGSAQAGTVEHTLQSLVMQFKSFPIAILERVVGKEMTIRSQETAWFDAAKDSYKSWTVPLVFFMVQSTALGYLSLAMKDIMKNREPRDFDLRQAMLAGGSAGIFGDFLMGEGLKNRHGGSFAETLAGPTAGTISGFANLWGRMIEGDDTASAALKTLYSNIPGNNLWFIKAPVEVMFMNSIYEMLNPGYTRRTRERMMRDNGQDILFQP